MDELFIIIIDVAGERVEEKRRLLERGFIVYNNKII